MPSARDVRASGLGFIDPVKTPAGGAGITEHMAINTQIKNGRISTSMVNTRTNRRIKLTPEDLFGKTVAFPEELELRGGKWRTSRKMVQVVRDGDILSVKPEEVDYIVPTAAEMYSEVTNLVPFLSANSGGRAILGTAQMVQAVSLINREAPLVSANNFEASEAFKMGQVSPVSGTVMSVGRDRIKIKSGGSGPVAQVHVINNVHLNRGAFINSEPSVKRGDRVFEGQLLADTNYGKGGQLALAAN